MPRLDGKFLLSANSKRKISRLRLEMTPEFPSRTSSCTNFRAIDCPIIRGIAPHRSNRGSMATLGACQQSRNHAVQMTFQLVNSQVLAKAPR